MQSPSPPTTRPTPLRSGAQRFADAADTRAIAQNTIEAFEEFQKTYPSHEMAQAAAYWKGMGYSLDKQYVRNWLDSIGFAHKPPAPDVPREVALRTSEKYQEALRRIAG
mgnify:CR=1 FL=1